MNIPSTNSSDYLRISQELTLAPDPAVVVVIEVTLFYNFFLTVVLFTTYLYHFSAHAVLLLANKLTFPLGWVAYSSVHHCLYLTYVCFFPIVSLSEYKSLHFCALDVVLVYVTHLVSECIRVLSVVCIWSYIRRKKGYRLVCFFFPLLALIVHWTQGECLSDWV